MRLSELKTNAQLVAEERAADPEFESNWQATALAGAIAIQLIEYRTLNNLSQKQLAAVLGMKQPQVARIERGETVPSIETLVRISSALDLEFAIDIRPAGRKPRLVGSRARSSALADYDTAKGSIIVSAI